MSPFLQRLLKDDKLQTYATAAGKIIANVDLSKSFRWADDKHVNYWHNCYNNLTNNSQFTEEDVEYIRINYPELLV